ncbi:MAG: PCRF domain-containing protein, partial [bacterium]|nr:PCRF domain-containing protein [bacterium]
MGGKEADLFAEEIAKMYEEMMGRYGKTATTILGKIRYIRLPNAFPKRLIKRESGVHRVQRIPITSGKGKVHTSTVGVRLVNRYSNKEDLRYSDLDVSTMRSSGPGGQNVNKVNTAVRILHKPSGLSVKMEGRSQSLNRQEAEDLILEKINEKVDEIVSESLKERHMLTDRSDKTRTYNFPNNRVTDHQTGVCKHNLLEIMT